MVIPYLRGCKIISLSVVSKSITIRLPLWTLVVGAFLLIGAGAYLFWYTPDPSGVATVNGVPIPASRWMSAQNSASGENNDPVKLLDALIDDELLFQYGVDAGMRDHDPVIRNRVIHNVLETVRSGGTLPSESELMAFYRKHISLYTQPEHWTIELVDEGRRVAEWPVSNIVYRRQLLELVEGQETVLNRLIQTGSEGVQWGGRTVQANILSYGPANPLGFADVVTGVRTDFYQGQATQNLRRLLQELRDQADVQIFLSR